MSAPAGAQALAGKHGGSWCPLDQGAILDLAKESGIDEAKRNGVCWEVCRRWIRARVLSNWTREETVLDILSPGNGLELDKVKLRELIQAHASRNTTGKEENHQIENLTRHKTLYRTHSCFGAKGVSSRAAVMKIVFGTHGAYIYGIVAAKGGGHAIALDTTGTSNFAIMDPNTGEGIFPNEKGYKAFFNDLYGKVYKDEYTKGERELTRYSAGPETE